MDLHATLRFSNNLPKCPVISHADFHRENAIETAAHVNSVNSSVNSMSITFPLPPIHSNIWRKQTKFHQPYQYVLIFGTTAKLIHDAGTSFTDKSFKAFTEHFGIKVHVKPLTYIAPMVKSSDT